MTVLVCSVQVYKAAVCKVLQSACGIKSHATQVWQGLMDWWLYLFVSLQIQVTCDTTLAWTDQWWLYLLASLWIQSHVTQLWHGLINGGCTFWPACGFSHM